MTRRQVVHLLALLTGRPVREVRFAGCTFPSCGCPNAAGRCAVYDAYVRDVPVEVAS